MDFYISIMEDVTVLATTIDGAVNLRTCRRTLGSNHDFSIIYPRQIIVDFTRSTYVASRRAEDHTVVLTSSTDGTASDSYLSSTTSSIMHLRFLILANNICLSTCRQSCGFIICKLTHCAIRTTTIYIMVYQSRMFSCISFADRYLSITLDKTGINIIITNTLCIALTTAIDIAEVSTALAFYTNRTASDIDIRIELNESTLTATKDGALYSGISIDGHIGLAG